MRGNDWTGVVQLVFMLLLPAAAALLIGPDDEHLFFSGHNWDRRNNSVAVAVNAGAYFKLNFTQSSTVSVSLNPTKVSNLG